MKIARIFILSVILIVASFAVVSAAPADPGPLDEIPLDDAEGLLTWLSDPQGGGWLVVSLVVAVYLEKWSLWHNLPAWVKRLIMLLFAGAIGSLATFALTPDVFAVIEPWLTPLLGILSVLLASELGHKFNKKFLT